MDIKKQIKNFITSRMLDISGGVPPAIGHCKTNIVGAKTKILVGVLILIAVAVGGWLILKSKEIKKPLTIKGKLEIVEGISPLFNKECLNNDLKVEPYYLKGICEKPYLAASLLGIIGEEIEVKGEVKEAEGVKVIEVEEIIPPEIIMITTETNQYQPGEKITLHLKHYLKKSVLSYFNTEKPVCAIKSIEEKDGDWKELVTWSQPADCEQIALKEINAYHQSGDFRILEWQPTLDPGQYKLKIVYKLSGEDEWKTVYSNEFFILKPEPESIKGCKVRRGSDTETEKEFKKVVIAEIGFNDYKNFFLKELLIEYGYGPNLFEEGSPTDLTLKLKSKGQTELATYKISDWRGVIVCETGAEECPPPQFLKDGVFILLVPFDISYEVGTKSIDLYNTRFIELHETERLPEWVFPEGKMFPGYQPGESLLRIDLSECMKKFCDEIALENDPYCVGEYYSPPTVIKGKITNFQGNPVKEVQIDFWEKLGAEGCTGSSYTDENGNYIINKCIQRPKLREGVYDIYIYPHYQLNLKSEFREMDLREGGTEILDITLRQCGSIAGKVTDRGGNPITEAWVHEIGFETPRTHVCEIAEECELGTFTIPYLESKNYKIGAFVKIGEEYIDIPPKEVMVELGKTASLNFIFER